MQNTVQGCNTTTSRTAVTGLQMLMFALFPDAVALWRCHHDGDDWEETDFVSGDQSPSAAREESVQAGQYAHSAQLEEEAAAAIFCPAHCGRTDGHGVLGHRHLSVTLQRRQRWRRTMMQPSGHAHHTDTSFIYLLKLSSFVWMAAVSCKTETLSETSVERWNV